MDCRPISFLIRALKQSAAGLTVLSGMWEDPVEYPGMAHFLEHMLFMGTQAYPNESEYSRFISDNGGETNAVTSTDKTIYMFSVNNAAFEGALDRFSHFFIDPLFSADAVDRELLAVDQEHSGHLQQDSSRSMMVLMEMGNPNHPHNTFSMGNAETLAGIPRSALYSTWYATHYSADQMHLVLISPLPLPELRRIAVQDFSKVPQFEVAKKQHPLEITSAEQHGKMIYIKPVKDVKTLFLVWEIPAHIAKAGAQKALSLVAEVLNHRGEGSLTQQLKMDNIATSVNADTTWLSKETVFLTLNVFLTDFGVTQIDKAISRIYEAIAQVKKEGIPSFLFDEKQTIKKLYYQYQSGGMPSKPP